MIGKLFDKKQRPLSKGLLLRILFFFLLVLSIEIHFFKHKKKNYFSVISFLKSSTNCVIVQLKAASFMWVWFPHFIFFFLFSTYWPNLGFSQEAKGMASPKSFFSTCDYHLTIRNVANHTATLANQFFSHE